MHGPLSDPDRKHEDLTDPERLQHFLVARDQIHARLEVLAALRDVPADPDLQEFHASIRVPDLPAAARFYTWLLGVVPKEWTHRYVTFVKDVVVEAHCHAEAARAGRSTNQRGTPLHELWRRDPGGNLIEIYARLSADEIAEMPEDKEPVFLVEDQGSPYM